MAYQAVVIFGPPGSGKGTQGKLIGQLDGFLHVATGDIFRKLDRESEKGKVFLQYSTRGELVPDEFTVDLWKQYIQGLEYTSQFRPTRDILLLDGMPRSVRQAKMLEGVVNVIKVVNLEIRDVAKMVDRIKARALKEKRLDDANETTILNRFEVYKKETSPVLDCFPKDKISNVDGLGSIIRVFADIMQVLAPVKDSIDSRKK